MSEETQERHEKGADNDKPSWAFWWLKATRDKDVPEEVEHED